MSLPDIRQLSIFIALEETRSFTEAAKNCFITQSAVSHSIKTLEKQLDCSLFDRLGKRLILTPSGEIFLQHSKRVVHELESGLNKLATMKLWGYSSIRIGLPDALSQHILPHILKDFTSRYPKCEIIVTLGDSAAIQALVRAGTLDLGFTTHSTAKDTQLTFTPLCTDTLCLITSPQYPWNIKNPQNPTPPRIISYSNNATTQRLIAKHLSDNSTPQPQTISVGNMEAIKEMVKLGIGIGIIPSWLVKNEIQNGSLNAHPISTPPPTRQWGIISPSHKTLSLPQEDFIHIAKIHLTKITTT